GASAQCAAELDLRQQFGMFLEELRMIEQVLGEGSGVELGRHVRIGKKGGWTGFIHDLRDLFERRRRISVQISISPSNTLTAGPVIINGNSVPAQAIDNCPPRVSTLTGESSRPRRMPATTAAHAPVPQASVSPAPRSNTRSFT